MTDAINSFSGKYRFLSNFVSNCLGYNVEKLYQSAKTMDPQEAQEILACDTPAQAKKLGRKIKNLRPDWDDVKYDIMASFVAYKFLSDDDLKAQLVATGDAELIEGNYWGDTYWGVCRGKGENNLGKILMNLRAEIVKGMGNE